MDNPYRLMEYRKFVAKGYPERLAAAGAWTLLPFDQAQVEAPPMAQPILRHARKVKRRLRKASPSQGAAIIVEALSHYVAVTTEHAKFLPGRSDTYRDLFAHHLNQAEAAVWQLSRT